MTGYDEFGVFRTPPVRDVTALSWGERYAHKKFVNEAAMQLITAHGGYI